MSSQDSEMRREPPHTSGGFDQKVTRLTVENENFIHATITDIAISLGVKYENVRSGKIHTTTVKSYQHKTSRKMNLKELVPKPYLVLEPSTYSEDDENIFIEVQPEDVLELITFDSVCEPPKRTADSLKIKIEGNICNIKNIGKFQISEEPGNWMSLRFHIDATSDDYAYGRSESCGNKLVQSLRERWAKNEDVYSSFWTITEVEDREGTEQATLTLEQSSNSKNTTAFTITAPDEWTDDNAVKQFIEEVGNGLLANTEQRTAYVTFDTLSTAEPVAKNQYNLKLYKPSDKPTSITERIRSQLSTYISHQ